MTVASLWKMLDTASCGRKVGEKDMLGNAAPLDGVNPWNYNSVKRHEKPPKRLAVDLAIWICESLTQQALRRNHSNPSLYLVFIRTMKLLENGIKPIFVVEGKRRLRISANEDKFHKRRSGSPFWKACEECKEMLEHLGLPVVRARAEGEALCALLNQRGIVDGVISNDGDCLLFGAKTIFTKFSIENYESSQVMRYELESLCASFKLDDKSAEEQVDLSREDLISFALLTGSDLAGSGIDKVGYVKALRFIRKCKCDNPLRHATAAIDELKSWSRSAQYTARVAEAEDDAAKEKCCSRCSHAGTKSNHLKHGCEACGTAPGESCFEFTADDRFRATLREKALALEPAFDPSHVLDQYLRPNENQVPFQLANDTLQFKRPNVQRLLTMPLIVKGKSLAHSREFIMKSVAKLLSRQLLLETIPPEPSILSHARNNTHDAPEVQKISKAMTHQFVPCYEVLWKMRGTMTDENGDEIDGYEYATIEPRDLVEKKYPRLIEKFEQEQQELAKQGDGEKTRRQQFLEMVFGGSDNPDPAINVDKTRKRLAKKHGDYFGQQHLQPKAARKAIKGSDDIQQLLGKPPRNQIKSKAASKETKSKVPALVYTTEIEPIDSPLTADVLSVLSRSQQKRKSVDFLEPLDDVPRPIQCVCPTIHGHLTLPSIHEDQSTAAAAIQAGSALCKSDPEQLPSAIPRLVQFADHRDISPLTHGFAFSRKKQKPFQLPQPPVDTPQEETPRGLPRPMDPSAPWQSPMAIYPKLDPNVANPNEGLTPPRAGPPNLYENTGILWHTGPNAAIELSPIQLE